MRLLSILVALCLSLGNSGCTTVGKGVSEGIQSIPEKRGLVLFSTGSDKTSLVNSLFLELIDANSMKTFDKVIISIDYPFKSNFEGVHAHVRSINLPEGEYYLAPKAANIYFRVTEAPVYKFRVRNNQATYIGTFQLSGQFISWNKENTKRDLKYFHEKNPGFTASFDLQPIELGPKFKELQRTGIIWSAP